jgi:hypothetical protein
MRACFADHEADDLLALVVSERLVLFYAQSGAGKSSLINTRLIPSLEENSYKVLSVGRVSGASGGSKAEKETENIFVKNLIRSLIQREIELGSLADLSLSRCLTGLNEDEIGYFYDAGQLTKARQEEASALSRRALIIDQFEEIFSTHPEAWEKRDDFFHQLAEAMQSDPYLWVVLVMREDYIAALDPYAHLLPGGLRARYYMQRLGQAAAIEAVERPAAKHNRTYAKGVAKQLVEDLSSINVQRPDNTWETRTGQYVEPVQLQVVCSSLWEKLPADKTQITGEDLHEYVGDMNQALGNYYEERVKAVAMEEEAQRKGVNERAICKWFGEELIIAGGIRGMVLREPNEKSGGLDDDIVQKFQGDLVRSEVRGGATWYELTHDRLVEPILKSNKEWFEENSSLLQKQTAPGWHREDRMECCYAVTNWTRR